MLTRIALAAVAIALLTPAPGGANDDDDHDDQSVTRVACVGGKAQLRLESESGDDDDDDDEAVIDIELRVDVPRPVYAWRLVLLHERRILYQGTRASTRSGYALRFSRHVPDWHGKQTVTARLAAPSGRVCRLEATI